MVALADGEYLCPQRTLIAELCVGPSLCTVSKGTCQLYNCDGCAGRGIAAAVVESLCELRTANTESHAARSRGTIHRRSRPYHGGHRPAARRWQPYMCLGAFSASHSCRPFARPASDTALRRRHSPDRLVPLRCGSILTA